MVSGMVKVLRAHGKLLALYSRNPVMSPYLPMLAANDLLDDAAAFRARMEAEGYLFLRGILPVAVLEQLLDDVTAVLQAIGWIRGGAARLEAESLVLPCREGESRYFEALDEIQQLESFHALAHEPALLAVMELLLGEGAFPHPLGVMRLVFPNNPEVTTPPHQDYRNNQGTPRLTAAWIPLVDCPLEFGPLAILPGSQRLGLLPLDFHLGPGNRQAVLPARRHDLRARSTATFPGAPSAAGGGMSERFTRTRVLGLTEHCCDQRTRSQWHGVGVQIQAGTGFDVIAGGQRARHRRHQRAG